MKNNKKNLYDYSVISIFMYEQNTRQTSKSTTWKRKKVANNKFIKEKKQANPNHKKSIKE